tara:strand:+ start:386 stop:589 length:204 start_codon:yes stop_codon:yes gene_type:complete
MNIEIDTTERMILLERIVGLMLIFIFCREFWKFNPFISLIIVIIIDKYYNQHHPQIILENNIEKNYI